MDKRSFLQFFFCHTVFLFRTAYVFSYKTPHVLFCFEMMSLSKLCFCFLLFPLWNCKYGHRLHGLHSGLLLSLWSNSWHMHSQIITSCSLPNSGILVLVSALTWTPHVSLDNSLHFSSSPFRDDVFSFPHKAIHLLSQTWMNTHQLLSPGVTSSKASPGARRKNGDVNKCCSDETGNGTAHPVYGLLLYSA